MVSADRTQFPHSTHASGPYRHSTAGRGAQPQSGTVGSFHNRYRLLAHSYNDRGDLRGARFWEARLRFSNDPRDDVGACGDEAPILSGVPRMACSSWYGVNCQETRLPPGAPLSQFVTPACSPQGPSGSLRDVVRAGPGSPVTAAWEGGRGVSASDQGTHDMTSRDGPG